MSACQIYSQIDFNPQKTWLACDRLCCVPIAWAFVVKVGIPWMFTEWIRGLMGYEAKSFVQMQRSVKRKNIPTLGTGTHPSPSCHWVMSSVNWGTLWALTWAQLWTGQHWKHTHVHMHLTNRDLSNCLFHILKRTALLVARLRPEAVVLRVNISISFSYHYSVHRGKGESDWQRHTNGSRVL